MDLHINCVTLMVNISSTENSQNSTTKNQHTGMLAIQHKVSVTESISGQVQNVCSAVHLFYLGIESWIGSHWPSSFTTELHI